MNIAMMQPAFIPWQGYFELIYRSDRFIFLDDFQFSVQSYHQRNRLFSAKEQVSWYTVPVQKSTSFKAPLNQTLINESTPWRTKMGKRLEQNYAKTPYYAEFAPRLEACLRTAADSLASQNMALIRLFCGFLGLEREFLKSSSLPSELKRSRRVQELLCWADADRYYCARGSFLYMKEDGVFPLEDIEVLFQNFSPKEYSQIGSPHQFVPSLSILDALMNIGPEATLELITQGTATWSTWSEMTCDAKLPTAAFEGDLP